MLRTFKASAVAALCCTVVGVGIAGAPAASAEEWDPFAKTDAESWDPFTGHRADPFVGTKKIRVRGKKVNVSCSGRQGRGKPVVVLLHGAGDGVDKLAALQKTLSGRNRVCSYDRLGAGASDQPDGPQSFTSTGKILSGVLDRIAGDSPVVLAGHSLGGLIAARYAPEHRDRVKGLVLMDATPATMTADIKKAIPASAEGPAAELRAQNLAIFAGQNPEKLVIPDGRVRSAGRIPVEVLKHGKQYLAAIPTYGPKLERAWSAGQRAWLKLSTRSRLTTATKSEHYIYVDQPEVAVKAIQRVAAQATRHR
ncbi:alpha/beta fold hydrolase [Nonomuraea fuscirosea]|uniref:alpha/beta fold hydrolase n=1 Tax=Nonomuraea fuscirosea TaxID=1291556 RepID=UPI0034254CA4